MCASRVFDCVPAFFCACLVGIHIARQPSVCASRVSDCVPAFMCVCLVGIYIARQPSVCASRVSDCVPAFLCACLVGNLDSAPTLMCMGGCVRLSAHMCFGASSLIARVGQNRIYTPYIL